MDGFSHFGFLVHHDHDRIRSWPDWIVLRRPSTGGPRLRAGAFFSGWGRAIGGLLGLVSHKPAAVYPSLLSLDGRSVVFKKPMALHLDGCETSNDGDAWSTHYVPAGAHEQPRQAP